MPYSKTTWIDNATPAIDAANLNNLENGVAAAPHGPDASSNQLPYWNGTNWAYSSIKDAQIDAAAAIAYSKLNLTGNIKNTDIATAAAITYNKLELTASITDSDIGNSTNLHKLAAVTGTPNGTKFLRDDGSWQTASTTVTTITGSVNSTGTINGGTGFTVNKTGTGTYTITFTTAFNNPPLVLGAGIGADRMFSATTIGTTSFQALTYQGTTASDTSFYFLARDLV